MSVVMAIRDSGRVWMAADTQVSCEGLWSVFREMSESETYWWHTANGSESFRDPG